MKRAFLLILFYTFLTAMTKAEASTEPIGTVDKVVSSRNSITFTCKDSSQLRLTPLTPDLIRIRASFKKPLPPEQAAEDSWTIAKTDWGKTDFSLKEAEGKSSLSTAELEIIVTHSPLLIEFRDRRTGKTINRDQSPMLLSDETGVEVRKRLGLDEHFYGLGEKAARLDKRRGRFTMWNTDKPAYVEGDDPIYQSVPFYIGLDSGEAYGIYFDNSYRSYFDFGRSSQEYMSFSAEGGELDYYFFWGPSVKKVIERYTELLGRMPMPPLWSLGNQQSRWSYYPDTLAEEIVRQYREHDLPLDVLYLDIHFMNGYRVFTWDRKNFPDPKGFTERLAKLGVKVVTIVDPGVKAQSPEVAAKEAPTTHPELAPQDDSYYVYNQGIERNFFLKRKSGELYVGEVWPGKSVFTDYTIAEARQWWGSLLSSYTDNGVAGIWNDMNEPSDFIDQTGKSQMDVVSYDNGRKTSHAKNRNLFALLMARATYEGLEKLFPNKRPFVLTRAGFAGIQRYSATWTGDNTSTWEAMALSLPMFQSLGLSGQSFVGSDIGGFIGRSDGELLTRWYQIGFLTPFCRNHKEISGYDHEPWRFGSYYEEIIRKYLKLRYRMLPFIYTGLEESHRTGLPLFRPLLFNYQTDTNLLNLDDQFMLGRDLMVAPILKPNQTSRLVYLPEGEWYDYWTAKKYQGKQMIRFEAPLETVPMFVRAGGGLVMGPEMNYVGEKPFNPLTFKLYLNSEAEAQSSVYEDDGESNDYKKGAFKRTEVKIKQSEIDLKVEGSYKTGDRSLILEVFTEKKPTQIKLNGKLLNEIDAKKAGGTWTKGWMKTSYGFEVRLEETKNPY